MEHNGTAPGASQESSGYGLFLVTILTYILIHSLLWVPHARLTLPLIPLVAIAGWHTIYILCRSLFYRTRAPAKAGAIAVLVLVCIWSAAEIRDSIEARAQGRFPYNESGHSLMEIGDWIRQNAPDSVIMTENPWALHFYSGEKTVRLPEAGLEKVFKAAKYYGVTHIIPDGFDPIYTPWVRGSIPGLKRVLSTSGLELFEIDFNEIAGHEE